MKDNKLLAEYLGFKYSINTQGLYINQFNPTSEPRGQCTIWSPSEDWNQLMMVVEKIKEELKASEMYCESLQLGLIKADIEAVYNACVTYIKQQKK